MTKKQILFIVVVGGILLVAGVMDVLLKANLTPGLTWPN